MGKNGSFWNIPEPLGPQDSLGEKQPARLGELDGKLLPYFGYKKALEAEGKGSTPLVFRFHLKLVRRREKKEKIKAEAFP